MEVLIMCKRYVAILDDDEYGKYVDYYQEDWDWSFVHVYSTDDIDEAMFFSENKRAMFESALIEFESRYKVEFVEVVRETKMVRDLINK